MNLFRNLFIFCILYIASIVNYVLVRHGACIAIPVNLLLLILLKLHGTAISAMIVVMIGIHDDFMLSQHIGVYTVLDSVIMYVLSVQKGKYKYSKIASWTAATMYCVYNIAVYICVN